MLNFRKLKQDYAPAVVKEGRVLFDKGMVVSGVIKSLSPEAIRLNCNVIGNFEHTHTCDIEIDRLRSTTIDSQCDCAHKYDCQHLSAVLFYLEDKLDEMLIRYSKSTDIDKSEELDDQSKATLRETIKTAQHKEVVRQGKKTQKELLQEYVGSAIVLGQSPYFQPEETLAFDQAELAVVIASGSAPSSDHKLDFEIQLALRLPYRSKPLQIPNVKDFLDGIRYQTPLTVANKRFFLGPTSFDEASLQLLKLIMDFATCEEVKEDRFQRAHIEVEAFGAILAKMHEMALSRLQSVGELEIYPIPCLFVGTPDEPLYFSPQPATISIELEYLEAPAPKLLLKPELILSSSTIVTPDVVRFLECADPGMMYKNTYYRFIPQISRNHLRNLNSLRTITIPEPLFGTFVENSLPELMRFVNVTNRHVIERFITLPYAGQLQAECDIQYLDNELEASLQFVYGKIKVPASASQLTVEDIAPFVTKQGILARNLTEEQKIVNTLFQDFVFDNSQGVFVTKSEKKIIEFMTEVIPLNKHRVKFNCPENLLDRFIYDDSHFHLALKETDRIDVYEVNLKVDGHLEGVSLDILWDCLTMRRGFIEMNAKKSTKKKADVDSSKRPHKILVLNLDKLAPIVHLFDEIGIKDLTNHREERPLWSLASIDIAQVAKLPITFT